jgi:prepilin-type N-terminal cleavage/methylation domain-containing protein
MKKQSGFTLIELAIVLVIIGLLLGGVLKGQELINSAKVKNMASDFKNIQVYIYGYQDKYKALPGDDVNAATHLTGGTKATTGGTTGNGLIEGQWDSTTTTDESFLFWQHVRLAGLAPGPTAFSTATELAAYPPRNADGGRIGVQSVSGFTEITNMLGAFVVCSDGILGKFAKQLDITLDDGETSTGSVRAVVMGTPGAGVVSSAVVDSTNYTVCMSF